MLERLRNEPVLVRSFITAVVAYLAMSFPGGNWAELEHLLVALGALLLGSWTRPKVSPYDPEFP